MNLNQNNKNTLFSFEVFPPKDTVALTSIYDNLGKFAELNPDYISVTYGAGGSQIGTSLDIASHIKNGYNIPAVAHLTCAGNTRKEIDKALNEFRANGVTQILALRGDLKEDRPVIDFKYATDLIEYVNDFGGFELSAACYPEGHIESPDINFDISVMKRKNDLGVKHFISQLFFDNNDFYRMVDAARSAGVVARIEAGIMPITSIKQITRTIGFSGCKLPANLTKFISRYENNPEAFRQAGINYALNQITDLLTSGVDGIHIYVMNNPLTAMQIYNGVKSLLEEINK